MDDLLLDPQIRVWVVVPIILITLFVGLGRHFVNQLIQSPKPTTVEKIGDAQLLMRGRLLRENGNFIPKDAFYSRKAYLNDKTTGVYHKAMEKHKDTKPPNPMTDPNMMNDMMKGQVVNMIPMIVVGQIINTVFSGFVTIRVPFPLTVAFKPMLQRDVELTTLSASWVSSMSFYFICVFGLRSVFNLILDNAASTDQMMAMQQQMAGAGAGAPPNPAKTFNSEWEAMEVVQHDWALNPKAKRDKGSGLAAVEQSLLEDWGADF